MIEYVCNVASMPLWLIATGRELCHRRSCHTWRYTCPHLWGRSHCPKFVRWVNHDILTIRLISSLKSFQIFLDKNEIGAIKCRPWLCESHAGSSQIIQCPRATLRISVTVRLLLLALHLAHQGTHPLQSSQSETRVQSSPERCRRQPKMATRLLPGAYITVRLQDMAR